MGQFSASSLMTWLMLLVTVVMVTSSSGQVVTAKEEDTAHVGELWAVLLAGSSGWYNYRHQADVCHAYQILHQHGVPDDHIIVMMADDIAYNTNNPTPGVIINRPNGTNVYPGVLKDYTGDNVTPEIFLKVLRGDAEGLRGVGSGKVLGSGPNDRVFINMVDHGAPGIFAFPDEYLNATDLIDALNFLHENQRYKQLVLYVESCESGSLFQNLLPSDTEVYALSASSPNQHSYACYLDETLGTYLGDVFSIKWMEDTDRENLHQETLKEQFKLVHHEVTTSSVMHWGELKLGGQKVARFLGNKGPHLDHSQSSISNHIINHDVHENSIFSAHRTLKANTEDDPCLTSSVASPDVPLSIFKARLRAADNFLEASRWQQHIKILQERRTLVKLTMQQLVEEVVGDRRLVKRVAQKDMNITQWGCYQDSVRHFHNFCFDLAENIYALRVLHSVVGLCEHGYTADQFLVAVKSVCTHPLVTGIM